MILDKSYVELMSYSDCDTYGNGIGSILFHYIPYNLVFHRVIISKSYKLWNENGDNYWALHSLQWWYEIGTPASYKLKKSLLSSAWCEIP